MEIVGPSAHLFGRGFGRIKTVLPFGKAEFTKGSSNVGNIGSTLYPSACFTSFDALELVQDEVDLPAIAVAFAITRSTSTGSSFGSPSYEVTEPVTPADPATDQLPSEVIEGADPLDVNGPACPSAWITPSATRPLSNAVTCPLL
jgi:hypothetical protein